MTIATTIFVYHRGDGMVSVSSSLPPGVSMSGHVVDRFRVHGSQALVDYLGEYKLTDFKRWKKARESEGFVFEPFPI